MEERSCVFGLKHQSTCIAPQLAETERNRFFVGTSSTKDENELYILDFDEDEFEISWQTFKHSSKIHSLVPCPSRPDMVLTTHSDNTSNDQSKASVWMMGALVTDDVGRLTNQAGSLSELIQIGDRESSIERHVKLYTLQNTLSSAILDLKFDPFSSTQYEEMDLECGAWDPHASSRFAVGASTDVIGWDIKSNKQAFQLRNAHEGSVTTIDFNPNKQYFICTGGKDGFVRIWDSRNGKTPVKTLKNHSFWVSSVSFNRFHDQLLLTSGADYEDLIQSLGDKGIKEREGDSLVCSYREYEDTVNGVAWSNADPWIFASLSFDGRVVWTTMVPKVVKYRIIL
ncbi:WD40-repeat-containing domain protein [Chytridium lagenaria]|nr:WD40-repeat-containing domain protein [Chytridium lagenaria]